MTMVMKDNHLFDHTDGPIILLLQAMPASHAQRLGARLRAQKVGTKALPDIMQKKHTPEQTLPARCTHDSNGRINMYDKIIIIHSFSH